MMRFVLGKEGIAVWLTQDSRLTLEQKIKVTLINIWDGGVTSPWRWEGTSRGRRKKEKERRKKKWEGKSVL